jgi:hypothetical protein
MKKVIVIVGLILASTMTFGQSKVVRDANGNFVTQNTPKKASEDKPTGNTYTTAKGEQFPVYVSKNGKYYVLRTSKETGNIYKQYLKTEN